jgi:hypothetical protein
VSTWGDGRRARSGKVLALGLGSPRVKNPFKVPCLGSLTSLALALPLDVDEALDGRATDAVRVGTELEEGPGDESGGGRDEEEVR